MEEGLSNDSEGETGPSKAEGGMTRPSKAEGGVTRPSKSVMVLVGGRVAIGAPIALDRKYILGQAKQEQITRLVQSQANFKHKAFVFSSPIPLHAGVLAVS